MYALAIWLEESTLVPTIVTYEDEQALEDAERLRKGGCHKVLVCNRLTRDSVMITTMLTAPDVKEKLDGKRITYKPPIRQIKNQ